MTSEVRELTLLHVEDEMLNQVLLRSLLTRMSQPALAAATVVEATSVAAALEALATNRFDLVLLDIQLPDGSGLQVAREIAAIADEGARPAVIALTAGALAQERQAALDSGCHAVVTKPYAFEELESMLVSTLGL